MPTGRSGGKRIAAACGAIGIGLLLGGCAGMMQQLQQELSGEKIEFKPLYNVKLDSRAGAATVARQGPAELARSDYMHLGDLKVTYIDKRCFPKDGCSSESHGESPTHRLLVEAAENGGDVVILGSDNARGQGQAVKNGRCLQTRTVSVPRQVCDYEIDCSSGQCYSRQTVCHTEYTYQEQCSQYEQIYGEEYYRYSRGSVWRKDPELIAQVRFGDAFFEAIDKGDVAQVEALAAKGVRADIYDLRGRYPLLKAVEADHTPVAAFLLEQGARADVENSRALVTASGQNNEPLVGLLLEHGADPNAKIGLWTAAMENLQTEEGRPLVNAVRHGNLAMARTLLQHDADPDANNGAALKQALDNPEMVALLLEHGATVREDGVLTSVAQRNDAALLRAFLERGADPDNRELEGLTPLQAAAQKGYVEIMRLLIESGADIDKRGLLGSKTPLMYAAENGQAEAVKLLLDHEADVTVSDIPTGLGWMASLMGEKGETALSLARRRLTYASGQAKEDAQAIVNLLTAAGATE